MSTGAPVRIYGWYDGPDTPCDSPSYDPPLDSACPHCGVPLCAEDVRTHMFSAPGLERGFFYRTHRSCDQRASDGERDGVFHSVIDRIQHNGDLE